MEAANDFVIALAALLPCLPHGSKERQNGMFSKMSHECFPARAKDSIIRFF